MEATIIHVMESWPLQLALETPNGREHLVLSDNAIVHRMGERVDPGTLQPTQRVKWSTLTAAGEIADLEILD